MVSYRFRKGALRASDQIDEEGFSFSHDEEKDLSLNRIDGIKR